MTLPASSNPISLSQVNVELGYSSTAAITMNDAAVRTLFSVASGAISMSDGWGKANAWTGNLTISSDTTNYNAYNAAIAAGWNGSLSAILTVTINGGVYVGSSDISTPAFTTGTFTSGSTLTIVNNGYIQGMGGRGRPSYFHSPTDGGSNGGVAISLGYACTINNTNGSAYIGGGGGGGGATRANQYAGTGGGGAGGGRGGQWEGGSTYGGTNNGGAGGAAGASGSNGVGITDGYGQWYGTGGGGGRIFPGTGGAGGTPQSNEANAAGKGGGAGGGGAASSIQSAGAGGSGNAAGAAGGGTSAGGGGGWGAAGGYATYSGGAAVALNGYTVTWTSSDTTRVYGSVA